MKHLGIIDFPRCSLSELQIPNINHSVDEMKYLQTQRPYYSECHDISSRIESLNLVNENMCDSLDTKNL